MKTPLFTEEAFLSFYEAKELEKEEDDENSEYQILKKIYSQKTQSSRDLKDTDVREIGDRVNTIVNTTMNILGQQGSVESDRFTLKNARDFEGDPNKEPYRLNLYCHPKVLNKSKDTVIILAHYDVSNIQSENVLDNTASIANIISIGRKVSQLDLSVNVVIAFTDAEELVSFTSSGAKRLANKINSGWFGRVIETINLELTAYGKLRWISGESLISARKDILPVLTPYNDSTVLLRNGIPSSCIGTFTPEDEKEVKEHGYCKTWSLCHTIDDKFELANREDMRDLVNWIVEYLKTL